MTVDRLALVLVYARQHRNMTGDPASPFWVRACRELALGITRW